MQGLVIEYLGLIVGVVLFFFIAPILAFCLIPIPAFVGGVIVSLFRLLFRAPRRR